MKTPFILAGAAGALLLALAHTACEVDSASGEIIVSPSSAALKKGQSIQFTASGGFEYRWRLREEKWGMLSTRRGQSTVYTSLYDPRDCVACDPEAEYQVIYADSYIPDGAPFPGNADTNNPSAAATDVLRTGEAYITHISEHEVEEEPAAATP